MVEKDDLTSAEKSDALLDPAVAALLETIEPERAAKYRNALINLACEKQMPCLERLIHNGKGFIDRQATAEARAASHHILNAETDAEHVFGGRTETKMTLNPEDTPPFTPRLSSEERLALKIQSIEEEEDQKVRTGQQTPEQAAKWKHIRIRQAKLDMD